jgi:type I restriction enzyme S subunit
MMEGWKEIALNEIGWFKGAGVNKLINTDEQPVYLVNYMDVYKHWRIFYNTNYQEVTAKDREIEEANLLEGDVLFTPSSEKPIDIGHAGVVMETMPNCVYSYHLIRLRLYDKTQFDLKFLSYLLNSDEVQKHFVSRASGSGIRYTLSLSDFKSAKIRFPEKHEQSAIAAMLSKVDEAIAAVEGSIAAAERLKKSLMQNLLTGRMKPDGTLRTEEEFYLDEKFGRVPKGWEVKKMGQLFDIKAGGDLQENYYSIARDEQHVYPIFSNTIVNEGLYGYTSNPRVCAKESLTIVGRGVGVGHIEIRRGNYDAIIRLISLIPKQENIVDCVYVRYCVEQFVHFTIESTGVPQLTCPRVFSTKIFLPSSVLEQKQIGQILYKKDEIIQQKQSKIAVLERLKKSLMQNLLTGKVNVQ